MKSTSNYNSAAEADTPKLNSITSSIEISHCSGTAVKAYDASNTVSESARQLDKYSNPNVIMNDEIRISFEAENNMFDFKN